MPKDFQNPNFMAKFDPKDVVWTPFIQQSGLQAATGNYSFVDPTLQKLAEQQAGQKEKEKDKPDAAPLLWVFLAALLVGTLIGFFVPSSGQKKGLLIVCCFVALGMAGGQAVIGFPIANQIKEQMKGDKGGKNDFPRDLGDGPKTSLKIPYFLTLLFCVGAIVTTFLEPARKPRRKRIVEEEDDEDEDRDDPPAW
jgi:F0F1-type ATP synthase assembly protein I